MATKSELQKKKEFARVLYMSGEAQDEIAEKTGVSRVTISRWVNESKWKEKRGAANITRPEIVNKLLLKISNLIEESDNIADGKFADKLSKFAATIEKLDKKANIVDTVEVLTAFGKWLQYRASFDVEVSKELVAKIVKLQDDYLSELMTGKLKL
ncbi:MAG: terminase [Prevotellaceae bacterium]|jgi:DNA-binding XRE family transcriptional regulator|nr:terminase [Prevotellaceae bacterium]